MRTVSNLVLASVLMALVIAVLALVMLRALVLLRRHRRMLLGEPRRPKHRPDPWREAGRRARPEPGPEADDDTVDLDPDDPEGGRGR